MKKQIISITSSACQKLKILASKNNSKAIYFYVKGGGCNGFNYHFEPTNDSHVKGDEVIKRPGYDLYVSKESILHLLGTEIDWKETSMGQSFHFENPMAQAKCGCGTSFTSKSI